jgi:hypothetical protein
MRLSTGRNYPQLRLVQAKRARVALLQQFSAAEIIDRKTDALVVAPLDQWQAIRGFSRELPERQCGHKPQLTSVNASLDIQLADSSRERPNQ